MTIHRHTVLLTRPQDSSEEFEQILLEQDINVLHAPMIEIAPIGDWSHVDQTIDKLQNYDGILFTSRNGVKYFFGHMMERNPSVTQLPPLHCVGEKTETELRQHGLEATIIPVRASAADLASALGDVTGKRFLHPCSDIAREELHEIVSLKGGIVEPLVVYRTIDSPGDDLQHVREKLADATIGSVAFFSPSAVKRFMDIFPDFQAEDILLAAIGQTTATELENYGLRASVVPQEQSASALATLIARYLTFKQSGALLTHG
jgi:uroporphyrinogen-III synthase